jgi:apolipoprotein N-acyltransferase
MGVSFPIPGWSWAAWVGPGLLFLVTAHQRGRAAFAYGYLSGLAQSLLACYWLLLMPFPPGAIVGWLALSAYLSLYPAGWSVICRYLAGETWSTQPGPRSRWIWRCAALVLSAAAWVSLEMLRSRLLTGFPWNLLGVSQYRSLALVQVSSVTGVYGISFLVVWMSTALATIAWHSAITPLAPRRGRRPRNLWYAWATDWSLPLLICVGVEAGGRWRLDRLEPGVRPVTLALVQPSIPQPLIWDPREATNRFDKLMRLSAQAAEKHPNLIVWPEAALPNLDQARYGQVQEFVRTNQTWMVIGAEDMEITATETNYYNGAFLLDPEGNVHARYHKRQLVMFGEFVPLVRWFPFLRQLAPVGEFKRGQLPAGIHVPIEGGLDFSVLICFEDVFPHFTRRMASADSDFLLNLTNNGWFGESAAQWQHAANAVFRAVEMGLPLVRCTNNGLTCWIDPSGRLHDVYFAGSPNIYQEGIKVVRVLLREAGAEAKPTIYRRIGDGFGWGCVVLTLLSGAGRWWGSGKRQAAAAPKSPLPSCL